MNTAMAERELKPFERDIMRWGYERLAEQCRDQGITPIWVYLPVVEEVRNEAKFEEQLSIVREAGFTPTDAAHVLGDQFIAVDLSPIRLVADVGKANQEIRILAR